jgi:hypothetical protein
VRKIKLLCIFSLVIAVLFGMFSSAYSEDKPSDNLKKNLNASRIIYSAIKTDAIPNDTCVVISGFTMPETPMQIRETYNLDNMRHKYTDATMNDKGEYFALLEGQIYLTMVDFAGSPFTVWRAKDGLEITSMDGVAYNPVDKNVYIIFHGRDTKWYIEQLNFQNPAIYGQWKDPVEITGVPDLQGLACTNDGEFYSYCRDGVNLKLYKINPVSGLSAYIGEAELNNAGKNISLEYDRYVRKCYMCTYNNTLGFDELNEVNLTTGELTRQAQFHTYTEPAGLAFYNGITWSPLENRTLQTNSIFRLEWFHFNNFSMNLEYSTDGGATWKNIIRDYPSITEYYDWLVPYDVSRNCYVRAVNSNITSYIYTSDRFSISRIIPISSPDGGEMWPANSTQSIKWTLDFSGESSNKFKNNLLAELKNNSIDKNNSRFPGVTANLYYRTSETGSWIPIAGNVDFDIFSENRYDWTVPDVSSTECRVKVELIPDDLKKSNSEDQSISSISKGCFTIYKPQTSNGKYTVTYPNGGEILQGGKMINIMWRKSGVITGSVQLEFSSDGGAHWQKINTAPVAGIMKYSWFPPLINSSNCFIRIVNSLTKAEFDRSDSPFSVFSQTEVSNYPNPFNPSTKIVFGIENKAKVALSVFNSLGQQVAELVNGQLEAGRHEYEFNGAKLPSGVYFYNLNIDGNASVRKMMLIK